MGVELGKMRSGFATIGTEIASDLRYAVRSVATDLLAIARAPLEFRKAAGLLREPKLYLAVGVIAAILGVAYVLDPTVKGYVRPLPAQLVNPLQTIGKSALYLTMAFWYIHGLYTRATRSREFSLTTWEAAGFASLAAHLLKHTLGRLRPRQADLHTLWFADGFSFPSGEVTPAAAVAAGISAYFGNRWFVALPAYGLAFAVGIGRMRRNAHWLSDVAGAMILGYLMVRLLLWLHGFRASSQQPSELTQESPIRSRRAGAARSPAAASRLP
jgi:membrane-associated phospholipid phosphatase